MNLDVFQDTLWFLGIVGWLLSAYPHVRSASSGRSLKREQWLVVVTGILSAAIHLSTYSTASLSHRLAADAVAAGLGALSCAFFVRLLHAHGWLSRSYGKLLATGSVANCLLTPSLYLSTGLLHERGFNSLLPWGFGRSLLTAAVALSYAALVWRHSRPFQRRRLRTPALLILVVSVGVVAAEGLSALSLRREEAQAETRGRTLALALDPEVVGKLHVDQNTPQSEAYRSLRPRLKTLRRANPDIAYLYLAAVKDGQLVYPVSGAEYYLAEIEGKRVKIAEPNEPFEVGSPVTPSIARAFEGTGASLTELTEDPSYGLLLNVYTPVARSPSGMIMLGMDYKLETYFQSALRVRRLTQIITLLMIGSVLLLTRAEERAALAEDERLVRRQTEERERIRNEFIGMVSHELQTPLHALLALSKSNDMAEGIEAHVTDLQRLVEDLLQTSALQSNHFKLHPRRFRLRTLFAEASQASAKKAEAKGLAFSVSYAPDLPESLLADSLRVRQIAVNLLSNAVKYTASGFVHFSVSGRALLPESHYFLELRVSDSGPGLSEELKARLGEPFMRDAGLARLEAGTGLGLSVTSALCRRMGGDLQVEANHPVGTVFKATLQVETAPDSPADAATLCDKLALVVEDHPTLQTHLVLMLEELGWRTTAATTIKEALSLSEAHVFTLAFVDQNLPDGLGAELIPTLRKRLASLWIIGMSASRAPEIAEAMLTAGADDFVFKPLAKTAVADALQQRQPDSGTKTPRHPDLVPEKNEIRERDWTELEAIAKGDDLNRLAKQIHYFVNTLIATQATPDAVEAARALEEAVGIDTPEQVKARLAALRLLF